jgi:uncharacterized membrane protein YdjX (TVP38/TMEM64 family)
MREGTPAPAQRVPAAWKRVLILGLLLAAVAAIASSDALYSSLLRVVAVVGKMSTERPILGAALFILLSAASAMLAFVSSAALVPVALFAWGKTLCALFLWVGWILGGTAAYTLGRAFGRPMVKRLLSEATFARYEDRIPRQAPFGLVLLFQLALPSEMPGYLLGLARYPFTKYLASLMLAELPYAVGTVYLGASFLDRKVGLLAGLGAAAVLLTFLALRLLHGRLRNGSAARDPQGRDR